MAWFSKLSYIHLMLICVRSFYVKDALDKMFEKISIFKVFSPFLPSFSQVLPFWIFVALIKKNRTLAFIFVGPGGYLFHLVKTKEIQNF